MPHVALSTLRSRRVIALAAAIALTATTLVAGPFAQRSSAAVVTASDSAGYWSAITAINDVHCGFGPHLVTIDTSISLTTDSVDYTCADDLTIRGASADVTVSGASAPDTRFLNATHADADITIDDLAFTDFTTDVTGDHYGGVIRARRTVALVDTAFADLSLTSAATAYGAAVFAAAGATVTRSTFESIYIDSTGANESVGGGAVFTWRSIAVTDSHFTDITAVSASYSYGGAIYAQSSVDVTDSTFTRVSLDGIFESFGGAIYTNAADVSGSTFTDNSVDATVNGNGGAIHVATNDTTVTDSEFTGNRAYAGDYAGGGAVRAWGPFVATDSTFTDNASISTDANEYSDGGAVTANSAVLTRSDFDGNATEAADWAYGGALYSYITLTSVDSTFTGNTATGSQQADGGAFGVAGGTVTVDRSVFTDNAAVSDVDPRGGAGAVYRGAKSITDSTFSGNSAGEGGALFVSAFGLDVTGSTFHDNSGSLGGAVYLVGETEYLAGESRFENSTLTANTASDEGGAVYVSGNGDEIIFVRSTLAANSAPTASQVRASGSPRTFRFLGSVLDTPLGGGTNCDLNGASTSSDVWWDSDETCVAFNGSTGDPMLGDLADNGGPTLTMAPLAGSPLIDALSSCGTGTTDQRGVARPQGDGCDLGAVEVIAPVEFTVVTEGGTITGTATNALSVDEITATAVGDLGSTPPAGLSLPFGVFGFEVAVPGDGWSTSIDLDLPSPVTEFWKVTNGEWAQFPGAVIDGTTVTYTLTDGATGDEDETANSVIVDPVAPGIGGNFTG